MGVNLEAVDLGLHLGLQLLYSGREHGALLDRFLHDRLYAHEEGREVSERASWAASLKRKSRT
jgi:hypothetical protein